MPWIVGGVLAALILLAIGAVAWQIRRRHMDRWLPAYFRERRRFQIPKPEEEIHVLLCICDHYEPKAGNASLETGRRRVATWLERYPQSFGRFRDSDGRTPRHTFFFPIEEYEKEYLDALAQLCRAGFGEVEVHLHHDHDTPEGFRSKLVAFRDTLVNQHGLLSRSKKTGAVMYGFIHGNWALCNARPDGRWCGVDHEIPVLLETGCYADFTFPSAPSATQPPVVNRIYYAADRSGQKRSQDYPLLLSPGASGASPWDSSQAMLMVQGPLLLDWSKKKWGFFPGVENGCLQTTQLPTMERLQSWLQARVQVAARPDWYFVKLHAHGGPEYDHEALLGTPMVRFHEDLANMSKSNPKFHYHYVTAREMVNLIKAAETGYQGPVAPALDWELIANSPLAA